MLYFKKKREKNWILEIKSISFPRIKFCPHLTFKEFGVISLVKRQLRFLIYSTPQVQACKALREGKRENLNQG